MYIDRTPLHYAFVDSNLIPLTRETAILAKKTELISEEIQQENNKQSEFVCYVARFDLKEHPYTDSMNHISTWLKEAKLIRLNQEFEEKSKLKKIDQELIITNEEKDKIRAYHTYKWERKNDIPERFDPIDIFKFLSSYKELKFDQLDMFSRSPLHYAACVGAFSCSTLLIAEGADMNVVDSDNVRN
jgi:hypothetical protein